MHTSSRPLRLHGYISFLLFTFSLLFSFTFSSCRSHSATMCNGDGIDISHHQGKINWKKVARHKDLQFVYIKATEGGTYQDPRYKHNLKKARRRGLKVGSYHFMRTTSSVWLQFLNFVSHVPKKKQDLVPVIDVEECKNWTSQQLADSVALMSKLLEKVYGQKPMIYTGQNFYNKHLQNRLPHHPLWVACYSNTPPKINSPYLIWQFTQKARLNGISTTVDLNRFSSKGNIKMLELK